MTTSLAARIRTCLSCILLFGAADAVLAQGFPNRPMRIVVPYPPGGGLDTTARIFSVKLAELLKQNVIIDNRAGAGGTLGTEHVTKSAPDGYTLLLAGRGPIAAAPLVYPKLAYSPTKDLAPVTRVVTFPYILVIHPSVPAKNAGDLIAIARANPGKLNMASGGAGGGQHIAGELFNILARTKMTHVPYKGTGPATVDLMGGHADLGFLDPAVLPHVKAGRLRAIGVSSKDRYVAQPDIPTIAESGLPGYEWSTWYALFGPADTPADVLAYLNKTVGHALNDSAVREKLLAAGLVPGPGSAAELSQNVRQDVEMLTRIVKETNVKPN